MEASRIQQSYHKATWTSGNQQHAKNLRNEFLVGGNIGDDESVISGHTDEDKNKEANNDCCQADKTIDIQISICGDEDNQMTSSVPLRKHSKNNDHGGEDNDDEDQGYRARSFSQRKSLMNEKIAFSMRVQSQLFKMDFSVLHVPIWNHDKFKIDYLSEGFFGTTYKVYIDSGGGSFFFVESTFKIQCFIHKNTLLHIAVF